MDKYKVKINPRAIHELDNIYEYIANEKLAPENAKGQLDRIKKAVLSLDIFPQSHQERNEGRYGGKGYRQLLLADNIRSFQKWLNSGIYAVLHLLNIGFYTTLDTGLISLPCCRMPKNSRSFKIAL